MRGHAHARGDVARRALCVWAQPKRAAGAGRPRRPLLARACRRARGEWTGVGVGGEVGGE
eukprot:364709-Chlamydomonas_euryale.AAC.26